MFIPILIVFGFFDLIAGYSRLDFNRICVIDEENTPPKLGTNSHNRRSITSALPRSNDYDDHSRGHYPHHSHLHERYHQNTQETKVYEPKEDPRLFYQSDAYLENVLGKADIVNDVASIYPGVDPRGFRPSHRDGASMRYSQRVPVRSHGGRRNNDLNNLRNDNHLEGIEDRICIKCPLERTLVAKRGIDKVLVQAPQLMTCDGSKAPRSARFARVYGPTFGSLLGEGVHMIVGKIIYGGQTLQLCRFSVHVVTQLCPTPKHLRAQCDRSSLACNLSCSDPSLELQGPKTIECGGDLKWNGELPVCRARTWCYAPFPPRQGRLSCQGAPVASGGFSEGTRCRARCPTGWRSVPHSAVCRRGAWTGQVTCQPRHPRRVQANNV